MEIPNIRAIVEGSMQEMLRALSLEYGYSSKFLEWYAAKELARFAQPLLFDPLSRVAREPLRKLDLEGRLIGAAQLCISHGFVPENILIGIVSSMFYENDGDPDGHISFMRKVIPHEVFFTNILGLRSLCKSCLVIMAMNSTA